ncbi:Ff.00g066750.m01.CDS01 [Fusarium sp. VM40]|nr:Ff.00g066750.m01.CDS01 [Fusarium sp. VM40]
MTSLHTLPSTWTAPTSCFASTNYYYVLLGGGFFSNLYGTPTPVGKGIAPSGDCFPPSFTINEPYITDGGCPSGYTRACATGGSYNGEPASTVTCCPSVTGNVFSFMCRDHQYGCHATATQGVTWTGVMTDIGLEDPTEKPVTRKPATAEGIEAWGIKFISITSTTSEASVATTTASETSDFTSSSTARQSDVEERPTEPSGLSTGAIAGIAIGAVIGFILLALVAFVLLRRKRKQQVVQNPSPQSTFEIPKDTGLHQLDAPVPPREYYQYGTKDQQPDQRQAWELP